MGLMSNVPGITFVYSDVQKINLSHSAILTSHDRARSLHGSFGDWPETAKL